MVADLLTTRPSLKLTAICVNLPQTDRFNLGNFVRYLASISVCVNKLPAQ